MLTLRYSDSELGYSWFVRSVSSAGSFFGDITDKVCLQQRNFRGSMSLAMVDRLSSLVVKLKNDDKSVQAGFSREAFRFSCGGGANEVYFKLSARTLSELPREVVGLLEELEPILRSALILPEGGPWSLAFRFA